MSWSLGLTLNTPGLRLQPKVLTLTLVPTPASPQKNLTSVLTLTPVGQLNVDRPRTRLSLKAPFAELAKPSPVIDLENTLDLDNDLDLDCMGARFMEESML